MKLSKEAMEDFKKNWYSYEEIQRMSDSLEHIEKWNTIPFEKIINKVSKNKKSVYV